uniref:Uncharacterized protein n=1 Tax=Meloidogyne enterolobii TaxID=390850 RepID=A0A6V7VJJ8_MELEN|nr:unnamed protein product [Meloidogyne enterolobii]
MNGEGTSSSNNNNNSNNNNSSSSKKRFKQLIQCRSCNCFVLAKDIDKHSKLNNEATTTTTNLSESCIVETPKLLVHKRVNKVNKTLNKCLDVLDVFPESWGNVFDYEFYRLFLKTCVFRKSLECFCLFSGLFKTFLKTFLYVFRNVGVNISGFCQNTTRSKRPSSTGTFNCNNSDGFISSQIALIEPNNGMALQLHSLKDEADWEKNFPMELYGWLRRHSALVNPEMFSAISALARTAFAIISEENEIPFAVDVVILWPCIEIPLMQIAFPPTFQQTFNCSSLIRLQLIKSFGQPLQNILLKPDLSKNEIKLQEWSKLSKLEFFVHFVKCYFGNALIFKNLNSIQIEYYGRKLNFKIYSEEEEDDVEGNIERKMESLCKIEDENGESNIIKYYPKVCKISHSCKFKIDWSEVLQLEINKDEKKNQIEEDDPDSLL